MRCRGGSSTKRRAGISQERLRGRHRRRRRKAHRRRRRREAASALRSTSYSNPRASHDGIGDWLGFVIFAGLGLFWVVASTLNRLFGRVGGSVVGGAAAGLLGWFLTSLVIVGVGAGIVVFVFLLIALASRGIGGGGVDARRLRSLRRRRLLAGEAAAAAAGRAAAATSAAAAHQGAGVTRAAASGFGRRRRQRLVNWRRWWRHLWSDQRATRALFPPSTLRRSRDGDAARRADPCGTGALAVEAALPLGAIRHDVSPRARALEVFSVLRVWDTAGECGVLVYLLIADRDVEIVADRGIDARVGDRARGRTICAKMEDRVSRGRFAEGVEAASSRSARCSPSISRVATAVPAARATSCPMRRSCCRRHTGLPGASMVIGVAVGRAARDDQRERSPSRLVAPVAAEHHST